MRALQFICLTIITDFHLLNHLPTDFLELYEDDQPNKDRTNRSFLQQPPPPPQGYFSTEVVTILHVPFNPPTPTQSYFRTEVVTIFHVPFNPNSKLFSTEVVTIFHVPFNLTPYFKVTSEQKWLQSFMYPLSEL